MKTLADLINELFDTHRKPNGDRYTNKEVSQALDGAIDQSTLSLLRSGRNANPGRMILLHLCRFFEVSPSYFFPELTPTNHHPNTQAQGFAKVLLRGVQTFSPQTQQKLFDLLESIAAEEISTDEESHDQA
ncbi:helix-turn-helix domain-containing protein [Herpetosiphon geysericola]|uniref:helix-turn-helix domain-containing protein n=1 Tax=Herpetosiphon geysericola TaxID=70996 RepID=UPI0006C90B3D|nr:helix-turn-helix transcriptional regulator [Herpetosiphon geysericola]